MFEEDALKGIKILLAEDNLDLQDLLKILLESAGAKVKIVNSGKQAIEVANQEDFDIVLMDIRMPVMSGIEATQKLRQSGFKTPILAITAQAMAEHLNDCIEAGCNDFVTKPIDENKLFTKILQYV